jgi:hypothetical protein
MTLSCALKPECGVVTGRRGGATQVMKESMQAEMARMEDEHRTRAAAHQARRRPSARPAALLQ